MSDKALSDFGYRYSWLALLPRQIPLHFSDGVPCPWCGEFHTTITFGENLCNACGKGFRFGIPDFREDGKVCSYVFPSLKEQGLLEQNPSLIGSWAPNERLKQIYFEIETADMKAGHA